MIVSSSFFKKEFDVSKAEMIGEGNFAQVFRVYDSDYADSLAIRRVDRNIGESEDIEKEKVINEELRRVENQNILKIFDIVETSKCVWYITEYCEGGSLWDALNDCKDNRMNEKDALHVIQKVSRGVRELHNHRITHRDLKPENILLKTKYIPGKPIPEIKIADFGLSTKKIIMETIAGTKEYIAPEQARFHNYTNAVDVWSLGIIFDQILHGNPFYIGDNNKEVFQKILKIPYKVRDESLRPSIKSFLLSILKKKPYERPIIASICQTIENIIQEVEGGKGKTEAERPEKGEKKKVNFGRQGSSKTPKKQIDEGNFLHINPDESHNNSENSSVLQSNRRLARNEPKETSPRIKRKNSGTYKQEQKKRNKETKTEEEEPPQASVGRVPRREAPKIIRGQMSEFTQGNGKVRIQRISIYWPQKKQPQKKQPSQEKANHASHRPATSGPSNEGSYMPIKEYVEKMAAMKGDLQKTSLRVEQDREFAPNLHLSIGEMPDKLKGEEVLKKFKQQYDCLNYMSSSREYEEKILKGKSELGTKKGQVEKEFREFKQGIKEAFMSQLDKYVDLYIDKLIH